MGRKRRNRPLSIRGLDFVLAFCYFLLPDGQFYLYANYFIVAGAAEGRKAEQRGGARGGEAGTNPICRLFVKKSHNSSLLAHIFHGGSDVAACRAHTPSDYFPTTDKRERLRDSCMIFALFPTFLLLVLTLATDYQS